MKHSNATASTSERRELKVLGIDLAKQSFQLHGVDDQGHVVLRRKLSRNQLTAFIANLPPCLIGLEACGGAHFNELYEEFVHLDKRIESTEKKLEALCAQNEDCQRLLTIPGIGLLTATALIAAIGDITVFKNGRELAAWLGLVPRQHSTGGKQNLLGISKRGDTYLRTLLIHGGRATVRVAHKKQDKRSRWIGEIKQRRGENISNVAVANKNARIAWAVLTRKVNYKAAA